MNPETPALRGPITRRCLNCNAKPGDPCTSPTSESRTPIRTFHHVRVSP